MTRTQYFRFIKTYSHLFEVSSRTAEHLEGKFEYWLSPFPIEYSLN